MGKTYSTGLQISPTEIQHNISMFAAASKLLMAVSYPRSFDWRKTDEGDYTTPIRDQGKCGSCVAFATIGLMESVSEIARKDTGLQLDLSEAYLFPRGGGNCANGAQFVRMLLAAESGVCDELCCPYTGDWKP
jgi:C1A family cysteine protease